MKHIQKIINESKEAFQQQEYETFEKLNIDFHIGIYNKCNNKLLINTIEDLWSNSNHYPSVYKSNDEHIQQSISEHDEICEALLKKDSLLAESLIFKHKES
ncbi:FCD domain-containing protein [Sporosarcina ureilytica]|uniref:GntR C-terminal domain-containing protein n=1 Tax=Sporosarcina ureilytica TaxID=298596 RepID=A0A1D8JFJ3_9BACL|nr:FCD domain-containing protein [Sporosarcina ureilytica]AOV07486.1 hypothetical protein BI350_08015 [Sporosarcina ureilytica]